MNLTRVLPVTLSDEAPPRARIGHNGGPPLDSSGSAWLWRRASRRAWRTPPREIALARLREAEALGLDYRDYASVIMDRGQRIAGVVIAAPDVATLLAPAAARRLARLPAIPIAIFVRVPPALPDDEPPRQDAFVALAAPLDGWEKQRVSWVRRPSDRRFPALPTLDSEIARFAAAFGIPRGALLMLGSSDQDRVAAEGAGLALYRRLDDWTRLR